MNRKRVRQRIKSKLTQILTLVSILGSAAPLLADGLEAAPDCDSIGLGPECGSNCWIPEYDGGPLPQPLTLLAAEDYALRHNKSLRALRNTVASGAWKQYQARSKWAPKASVEFESKRSEFISESPSDTHKQKLAVDQLIYDTASYYGICAADLDARALELTLLALTNDILFDARAAYYALVISQEELDVQKDNVEILAGALEREEGKYEVGESTKFEVRQSKVSVANALSSYYQALRNHKVAQNSLLTLLGLDPQDDRQLLVLETEIPVMSVEMLRHKAESLGWTEDKSDDEKDDFIAQTFRVYSQDTQEVDHIFTAADVWQWEDRAVQCRPAIKRSCVSLSTAENNVSTKKGEWHPKITGYASATNSSKDIFKFDGDSTSWEAGLKMNWLIFDGLGRHFRIEEARSKRCAAMINHEQELQRTRIAIGDRFHDLEGSFLSYFAASQSVRLAEEAIELAENRRDLGVTTALEYRDVANSLREARQSFNRASFSLMVSYYALRREAGVDVADNACLLLRCCDS